MKKRKFRFNAIDAIIILIVLAAVAVFGYVFMSDEPVEEEPEETVKIQYVLQTTETRERFVNNISESDIIYELGSEKILGTVVSVTDEPSYFTGTDGDSAMQVISEIEGRRNMFITVEAEAQLTKNGYSIDGNVITVGGGAEIVTPNMYTGASVISIEVIG